MESGVKQPALSAILPMGSSFASSLQPRHVTLLKSLCAYQ